MTAMASSKPAANRELTITRVFDAPRALVFKAWTDPKLVAQWWGPSCFTNPVCELDVRPGGAMLIHMRGPDGTVYPTTGVYDEVIAPERLVFTDAVPDENGSPHLTVRNTVTFVEEDGKTRLTLHARVIQATETGEQFLSGMEEGWTQSLERLAQHLASG